MPDMPRTFRTVLLMLGCAGSASGSLILTLTPPGGIISGMPGTTTGWGFTLTNDSGYAEINLAQFCSGSLTIPCTPSDLGTFTDFISANDVIVGPPGGTLPDVVTQSFDELAQTGIGSFNIAPGASGTDTGQILLTYTLWDMDPNSDGAMFLSSDNTVTAAASISVTAAAPTPEPASAGLVGIAFAIAAAGRQAFKRSRQK